MTATPARFQIARRAASAGVVALALLGACESELPTSAQIDAMDATSVALRTTRAGDSTVYYVSGRLVSKDEATAVASGDISSIEVVRTKAPRPVSEVRILLATDSADSANRKVLIAARKPGSTTSLMADTIVLKTGFQLDNSSAPARRKPEKADGAVTVTGIGSAELTRDTVFYRTPGKPAGVGDDRVFVRGDSSTRIVYRKQQSCSGTRIGMPGRCEPLVFINGVESDPTRVNTLDRNAIESIEVIKGAAAERLYGDRGVDGVIVIKLKQ